MSEAQQLTRLEAKAEIRAAFQTGRATLAQLAMRYGIPYSTVTKWSHEEQWSVQAASIQKEAGKESERKMADWLAEQQVEQMKRGVRRALAIQSKIDAALELPVLKPADIRDLATAEDKADAMARRNLSMSGDAGSGPAKVSVNILSGNVHLSS